MMLSELKRSVRIELVQNGYYDVELMLSLEIGVLWYKIIINYHRVVLNRLLLRKYTPTTLVLWDEDLSI